MKINLSLSYLHEEINNGDCLPIIYYILCATIYDRSSKAKGDFSDRLVKLINLFSSRQTDKQTEKSKFQGREALNIY